MEITSKNFGTITVNENDLLEFKQPIFGFEDCRRFVMLYDDEIGPHFTWLQSVEEPELCFILTNASALPFSYPVKAPAGAAALLGEGACETWVVSVITEDLSQATVNLKSPVFINRDTHFAAQVILEEDYPIRYPLFQPEEGAPC